MNKRLISFLLLGSVLLTGCSNTNSNSDLESRVSELEQRVSALEIQTSPTVNSQPTPTTENTVVSSSETEAISDGVYSISDMTANEIFDLVMYYYENCPVQGETYEELHKVFRVEPLTYYSDGHEACFNNDEHIYWTVKQDEIYSITYGGTRSMKGDTIDVPDNGSGMGIVFCIQDYDKAEAIFTLFENYYKENSRYENVSVNRNSGYQWDISYTLWSGDHGWGVTSSMQKTEGGYIFQMSL